MLTYLTFLIHSRLYFIINTLIYMRTLFILVLCVSSLSISAQTKSSDDIIDILETTSVDYLKAFTQNDWEAYTSYAHPNIIKMAGGKELLVKLAQETLDMYKSIGYDIKSGFVTGDSQIVNTGKDIQAIIPTSLYMVASGQNSIETKIKLFAISNDFGESWKFVDLSQYDKTSIKTFVPEFNETLFDFW